MGRAQSVVFHFILADLCHFIVANVDDGRQAVSCVNQVDSGSVNFQCWDDLKAQTVHNACSVNRGSASEESTTLSLQVG